MVLLVVLQQLRLLVRRAIEHRLHHFLLVVLSPLLDGELRDFDGVFVPVVNDIDDATTFVLAVLNLANLASKAFVPGRLKFKK